MRKALFTGLCLLFILTINAVVVAQDDSCPSLPSRLEEGSVAQVTPGSANRLRSEPSTAATQIGAIPAGEQVAIFYGPSCSGDVLWWQVKYQEQFGWTAEIVGEEYALEPVFLADFEAVSFTPPAAVSQSEMTVHYILEAIPDPTYLPATPAFLQFLALDDTAADTVALRLRVYPAAVYARINPFAADQVFWLEELLTAQPPLNEKTRLPHLPLNFDTQDTVLYAEYLKGEGISGIRYLTRFSNEFQPYSQNALTYTFQGLSDDGYYVVLSAPVIIDALPAEPEPFIYGENGTDPAEIAQYREETLALLSELTSDQIQPSLTTLDDSVRSLEIDAGLFIDQESISFEPYRGDITPPEREHCAESNFPSRLTLGEGAVQILPKDEPIELRTNPQVFRLTNLYLQPGDVVKVIDGPFCNIDTTNWLVYDADERQSGWIAESGYYLEETQYVFEPASTDIAAPEVPMTGCAILPFRTTPVYATPNRSTGPIGYLSTSQFVTSDALLDRPAGGFLFWRLPEDMPYLERAEQDAATIEAVQPLWVYAGDVSETSGCQDTVRLEGN
jgi:hypothetical protein